MPVALRRFPLRLVFAAVLLAWAVSATYQIAKSPPPGVSTAGPPRAASDVRFLADWTYLDTLGVRRSEQTIFDEVFALIAQAERLVVLDMFLFNAYTGRAGPGLRPLSAELTEALIRRKREVPGLRAIVITDPVNTVYGGLAAPHLAALEAAGIDVVTTDLRRLRASNPLWSGLWHLCCARLGNDPDGGWLPNPFGAGKVSLRSYLALLNFRANHRKTIVADAGEGWAALVTSANPHDGSSAHGNVALRFGGAAALDLLQSERPLIEDAGLSLALPAAPSAPAVAEAPGGLRVQVLTERRIRDALLERVQTAAAGDRIDVAVFYLSHRPLLRALLAAQRRGVALRVLLDPNRDAFGREKNGIPNRPAAAELHAAGLPVRWCDTHGEQCHAKLLLYVGAAGEAELILGSANYTRRNLDGFNLETNVRLLGSAADPALAEAAAYFEDSWTNAGGRRISLPYEAYADESAWSAWRYRFGEASGLSTY
ncbi:MAG TPA: phospholipase D family protein [Dokdonella sp.]|uniref:phospholipase D family protein n=1 Tax=Dokdonella sp. TaxID=2291710 RepID=UPI002BFC5469|nr:phospholipase D family protein [Dokdonella sp.]HUD40502.1 phospholipase D family protein [Dokdonella sp.]